MPSNFNDNSLLCSYFSFTMCKTIMNSMVDSQTSCISLLKNFSGAYTVSEILYTYCTVSH